MSGGINLRDLDQEVLVLKLSGSQNINLTDPSSFVTLNFSRVVKNSIEKSSCNDEGFSVNNNLFFGTFTLPKGEYTVYYKVNVEGDNSRKNGICALRRFSSAPKFYPETVSYAYTRGSSNSVKFGTIVSPEYPESFVVENSSETFGMTATKANSNSGVLKTIVEQSFLVIKKL